MKVRFLIQAQLELDDAVAWYNQRSEGLGQEFLDEVDRVVRRAALQHRRDKLLWGSDFPHQESDWPESLRVIDRNFAAVPDEEKHKMVRANAVEFFRLAQD